MPKVSVIIITFNRPQYVCEAVDSVLRQTFSDFEVIVVDDGSAGNTGQVLEKYGPRVKYIFQEHKGRPVARNTGISAAKGEYIAFLDDDDAWLPEKLKKQVAYLDDHPEIGLTHSFIELMDETGRFLPAETRKQLRSYAMALRLGYDYRGMSRLCAMYTSTVLLRKSCLSESGVFDPELEAFEDWDFYLRFALKYKIGIVAEPLVRFRTHKAQTTQNEFVESRIKLALKHLALTRQIGNLSWRKGVLCNFYLHLGSACYMNRDYVNSRKYIIEALKLKPFVLFLPRFEFRLLAVLLIPFLVNNLRQRNVYPERIIPKEVFGGVSATHLKRYEFVRQFCENKVVLDAACGVGYGVNYLAASAKKVIGLDISEEAIAYAKGHYQRENTRFEIADVCRLDFPDGYFDTVCSFETIEHLDNPQGFLAQVRRVLKTQGVFIVSTPCVSQTSLSPRNPYHKIEFSKEDFRALLSKYFSDVQIFGQSRRQSISHYCLQKIDIFHLRAGLPGLWRRKICHALATRSWDESALEDFVISAERVNRAFALIGVCKI